MHEIINQTPFKVDIIPAQDKNGDDFAVVVMKGTFQIRDNQHQLQLAEKQLPIVRSSKYYGESGKTSLRYEADVSMFKHATDIVLNGHAYAPRDKPAVYVDVSIQVNDRIHSRRVFGNRYWAKRANGWHITPAEKFQRLPLIYENAYGGFDHRPDPEGEQTINEYNPVGKGHLSHRKQQPDEGLVLPNIEDPDKLIQHWQDRPKPVGFGFISSHWQPRVGFAGTYDAHWEKNRCPLLPVDFDDRYYNSAHPDFMTQTLPAGGEMISIKNATESGELAFKLPRLNSVVTVKMNGKNKSFIPMLDTVLIESDPRIVQLTWRATVPCSRKFLYIDSVTISENC